MPWNYEDGNELDASVREMIPERKRIAVPLYNKLLLREVGDLLAGYGQRLKTLSTMRQWETEGVLYEAIRETDELNEKIKAACRRHGVEPKERRRRSAKA